MKKPKQSPSRRLLAIFGVTALIACTASPSSADPRPYPDNGDHPLRILHYFFYPVGKALELGITRPLHAIGHHIAPYEHIDARGFRGCSRERPARSCSDVVK